jgi:hypothetical protein
MQKTRISSLLWAALIAIPIGWIASRLVDAGSGALPPVPWILPSLLLFLAMGIFAGARTIRQWITERRFDRRIDALRVARALALAKATEYFGAVVAGAYVGLGLHALSMLAMPMGRNRAIMSTAVVVCAIIMTLAAVRLERACEVPPPADED